MADVVDVVLIGSGASGGPFAWHLSTAGLKIVCFEQGDWLSTAPANLFADPDGYAAAERERLAAPPPRANTMYFPPHGYPYDYSESSWQPILGNAVGGATTHYGAQWARLHPCDFALRTLSGVADDWPITYWDLAPYYDMIDMKVGVEGVLGDPAYPPRNVKMLPPYRLSRAGQFAMRAFEKLHWHCWPGEAAVLTVPHDGRPACTDSRQTPGHMRGDESTCPAEAKNRADVVFWPEAIRRGVVLKTRSRVREITVNKQGLADGVLYYDADGKLLEQKARIVVVACNGIGTPRLLLNSKSRLFPEGLANSNGQVGKNLMGHPYGGGARGEIDENLYDPERLVTGVHSHQFYASDAARGFGGGLSLGVGGGAARAARAALGDEFASPSEPSIRLASHGPRTSRIAWGALHHAAFQERVAGSLSVGVSPEELPSEANRVELDSTLKDDTGIPAPKLFYKASENTLKAFEYGIEKAKEILDAIGVRNITVNEPRNGGSVAPGHYMGTARMGDDPRRSVVNKWGCAHDCKNLYVIDGSAFTTSAAVLPTATIQALGLRTADYLKKNARSIPKA